MTLPPDAGAARATARRAEMSPKRKARLAGALLLCTIVAGGFAQGYGEASFIVAGDAAATASRIMAQAPLYRLVFAVYLVEMACQIAMTVLYYELLRPVSKSAAMLAATFGLIGCIIKTLSRLFFFAPLLVLNGAGYLGVFDATQLPAIAYLSLRLNYTAETMAMVFFGLHSLMWGYLVLRSTFLPRALGALSLVGGCGWLMYLYEPLAHRLQAVIVGTGVIGALVSVTWLLVYGVNEQRWREQDAASRQSTYLP